jgi:hypothetical protein
MIENLTPAQFNRELTDFFNGDVAEVLVFNRAVTDDERNTISNYLSRKYAIPV